MCLSSVSMGTYKKHHIVSGVNPNGCIRHSALVGFRSARACDEEVSHSSVASHHGGRSHIQRRTTAPASTARARSWFRFRCGASEFEQLRLEVVTWKMSARWRSWVVRRPFWNELECLCKVLEVPERYIRFEHIRLRLSTLNVVLDGNSSRLRRTWFSPWLYCPVSRRRSVRSSLPVWRVRNCLRLNWI